MVEEYNITAGEDFTCLVSLQSASGIAWTGADGGSMTAYLVDRRQDGTVNGSKVAQSDSGNADWASGTVEVKFSDVDTATLSVGRYYLRLDVTQSDATVKKLISPEVFQVWSEA